MMVYYNVKVIWPVRNRIISLRQPSPAGTCLYWKKDLKSVLILWRTPHLGSDGQICGTRLSSSIQMTLELEQ